MSIGHGPLRDLTFSILNSAFRRVRIIRVGLDMYISFDMLRNTKRQFDHLSSVAFSSQQYQRQAELLSTEASTASCSGDMPLHLGSRSCETRTASSSNFRCSGFWASKRAMA